MLLLCLSQITETTKKKNQSDTQKLKLASWCKTPLTKSIKQTREKIFTTYKLKKGVDISTIGRLATDLPENTTNQIRKQAKL